LRLVDPDNRGPVNFGTREAMLERIANLNSATQLQDILEHWHDGRIKLYLIRQTLRFRREHCDLFQEGEFIPLESTGRYSRNLIAFLRRQGSAQALIVVPRWLSQLNDNRGLGSFDWADTRLAIPSDAPAQWNSVLAQSKIATARQDGGSSVTANDLFREFPVALFHG
jgi:(1->4)-alpha-D-glucan 1-alpha-D-glucosylmutase